MTTPRPGSRAEQRRRTEARILDAATQVFFSAGYDRTTIRAVASAAGVDAGLVMHYFGSKQELYRRVIDAPPVKGPESVRARREPARWLARTSLVCAHKHVARDRGGGDHIERVDAGGQGAWMHRDADGLIGLVQPAGR